MSSILYLKSSWIGNFNVLYILWRWIFERNKFPVSNNFSSISMTSMHLWRSVKNKKKRKPLYQHKKNANCLWDNNSKQKSLLNYFGGFVKNDGVDQDDNVKLVGSKPIATWSQSTRFHGLNIFEDEPTEWFLALLFVVKFKNLRDKLSGR